MKGEEPKRNAFTRWKKRWDKVLDLLFPPRCPCCGTVTEAGAVCPDCEQKLPWIEGDASVRVLEDGLLCCGPLWYEGVAREAILALKFQGRSSGAKPLGEWIAACAAERLDSLNNMQDGTMNLSRRRQMN